MNHTPGPWEYNFREECHLIDALTSGVYGLAMVGEEWCVEEDPKTLANARLIAQAPALLEALEEILSWDTLAPVEAVKNAQAVVQAARGEA